MHQISTKVQKDVSFIFEDKHRKEDSRTKVTNKQCVRKCVCATESKKDGLSGCACACVCVFRGNGAEEEVTETQSSSDSACPSASYTLSMLRDKPLGHYLDKLLCRLSFFKRFFDLLCTRNSQVPSLRSFYF